MYFLNTVNVIWQNLVRVIHIRGQQWFFFQDLEMMEYSILLKNKTKQKEASSL